MWEGGAIFEHLYFLASLQIEHFGFVQNRLTFLVFLKLMGHVCQNTGNIWYFKQKHRMAVDNILKCLIEHDIIFLDYLDRSVISEKNVSSFSASCNIYYYFYYFFYQFSFDTLLNLQLNFA